MKVFVSSVIRGLEDFRASARAAAETLRHDVLVAEDFGAAPGSPQQTCLAGVREADVVILLLGDRYGPQQESGLSATHEEYREARGRKPVLAYVQHPATPEPSQRGFIEEVQGWEGGQHTARFDTPDSLRQAVIRGLHDLELTTRTGPVDEADAIQRAHELLGVASQVSPGAPRLIVAAATTPRQTVLRPRELEQADLCRDVAREAVYGEHAVFATELGVRSRVEGSTLVAAQDGAEVRLTEEGSIRVTMPAVPDTDGSGFQSLIEEDLHDRLLASLGYLAWLLDRVDPTRRLTHVAVTARVDGGGYLAWRTRAEVAANPGSMSLSTHNTDGAGTPGVLLPRAALQLDAGDQADDLLVRLRRQLR